jgi:hypothetical protein
MARGIVPPRVLVVELALRVMAHAPVGAGGGGARQRLLVRSGDFSGDPSCRELVGDAANWLET